MLICSSRISNNKSLEIFHSLAKGSDVEKIKEETAGATNIKLADQDKRNSKEDLIGSVLSSLVIFLKSFVPPFLTGIFSAPSLVLDGVRGALQGLSKDGLIGLLGGLAKETIAKFRKISSQIAENFLKGTCNGSNCVLR